MDVSTPLLDQALQFHRAGELVKAEAMYRGLISVHPKHADALHLLGMVCHQTRRTDEAERLIRQAISIHPNQAVYHSNLGLVLAAAKKPEAAIEEYRLAAELNPKSAEALNNLAVALCGVGATSTAIDFLKRAVLLQPDYADARLNLLRVLQLPHDGAKANHTLGDLFAEAGRPADAARWYRQAIALQSESAESHNNLGNALFAMGEREQALACYQRALSINPNFPQACNNLANVLREMGRVDEAIAAYEKAIQLQPNSPEPLSNLANLLREAGEWEVAMQLYQRALAIDPDHVPTHNNIGNAHCERGSWPAAIESYERAIAIQPTYADAINNLGTALEEIGQRQRAMQCYQTAAKLDPSLVSPPWNIALLQLLQGDYENGWPGYEHRWRQKRQSRSKRNFTEPIPRNLQELRGKRILLHAEQGFGDAMQFCRYAPLVAEAGAEVLLECPAALVRLFSQSFIAQAGRPGIEGEKNAPFADRSPAFRPGLSVEVVERGEPLPSFDLHCPLMSLPMLFGTTLATVPATVPYLRADPLLNKHWQRKIQSTPVLRYAEEPGPASDPALRDTSEPASKDLRVGLVWAGQSTHQKDRHRSLIFADFADLIRIAGVTFYSLQVGESSSQCNPPVIDCTADLKDFADTAALISQLDLVIAVDTAVAHLAGAMGKTVWILLAYQPDWRWLLDRTDSPWYPSATLFRQLQPDDWSSPLKQLKTSLQSLRPS
jgi:tetratricopeptide (TPR) repeat protein